ncbi:zinc-dependent metalloprotease family protein [Gephyromycinifex aptenodytis]|uniref:zinc-dependent metalloprotease family protein n=1 Tax=Gephyromycinifex aptenodytis TaxID=2716227 RepID=UPI001447CCFD|nr:hypothetical protein [Gephyromycinifex aptenodytis]
MAGLRNLSRLLFAASALVFVATTGAAAPPPARPVAAAGQAAKANPAGLQVGTRPAAPATQASARRRTTPPRPVYVVRLLPPGSKPDANVSSAAVGRMVAGANSYWSQQSRGQVSFRLAKVSAWTRTSHRCDDIEGLWGDAYAREPAATKRAAHLVVIVPGRAASSSRCLYGFGSNGFADSGGSTYVSEARASLLAHELGHNLGLGHSGSLLCPRAQDGRYVNGSWRSGCRRNEYDDLFDVMGYSGRGFGQGSLNAVNLDRLGADPAAIRSLSTSARVPLAPLSASAGVRGVKMLAGDGVEYYAEYRTATGRDAAPSTGAWRPRMGVRILRVDPETGDSLELDATPAKGSRFDRALLPGRTFVSASGRLRVRVVSANASGAVLDVRIARPSVKAPRVRGSRT